MVRPLGHLRVAPGLALPLEVGSVLSAGDTGNLRLLEIFTSRVLPTASLAVWCHNRLNYGQPIQGPDMMKFAIFIALTAISLAVQPHIAVADEVPTLDYRTACRSAGRSGVNVQACLDGEQSSRESLVKEWAQFAPEDRARCTRMATNIAGARVTQSCLRVCEPRRLQKACRKNDRAKLHPL